MFNYRDNDESSDEEEKIVTIKFGSDSDYFNKKYIIWSSHSSLWVYYRMECLFLYFGRDIHSNFFEKLRDYFLLQQLDTEAGKNNLTLLKFKIEINFKTTTRILIQSKYNH